MPRFSTVFGLTNSQATLDFVDVELSTDNPLFLEPYAIQVRSDEWSSKCGDHIRSFFVELLNALRQANPARATHLVSNLHEPNETCLGVSSGKPRGRGVGDDKAGKLLAALKRSRAFKSGLLQDVSEAELFIYGVGRDTISDLTTNIIRGLLADYTRQQCELHDIPTHRIMSLAPCWSIERRNWISQPLELPVYAGNPILLVPKFSIRLKLSLVSQDFWNHYMLEFLREEHLNAGSSLVHILKNGERRVYKKELKEIHPFNKDDFAEFTETHPQVLDGYKRAQADRPPLKPSQIYYDFNERAFASALKCELPKIPTGGEAASRYHHFMMGVCTFLFYPNLITPVKEQEIHQGRKRIDIKYTNAAESGFFLAMLQSHQARCLSVPIECKNYTKELNNPELDQLSGRFSNHRGHLGFVLCRNMDDRSRIVARCKDTVADGRGYILVFQDSDIIDMLEMVERGEKSGVDRFLQSHFDEITH